MTTAASALEFLDHALDIGVRGSQGLELAGIVEGSFEVEIPAQDASAIAEMKKRGLTVDVITDPAIQKGWTEEAESFAAHFSEAFMPQEIYVMARKARDEFRARNTAPEPDN